MKDDIKDDIKKDTHIIMKKAILRVWTKTLLKQGKIDSETCNAMLSKIDKIKS